MSDCLSLYSVFSIYIESSESSEMFVCVYRNGQTQSRARCLNWFRCGRMHSVMNRLTK